MNVSIEKGRISSCSFKRCNFPKEIKWVLETFPFKPFDKCDEEWGSVMEASFCLLKIGSDGKHMQKDETIKESFSI